METWEAITARRNVRAFSDRAIAPEDLDRILEAGRRSPSSMNEQPWDLVLTTDRARMRQLAEAWTYGGHLAGAAAAIAFICEANEDAGTREIVQFDMGQATMSVMLAAADLGIGSCHSAVGDQAAVRAALDLPVDRECVLLLSLGYPAGSPLAPIANPDRRPFAEVVHRERW